MSTTPADAPRPAGRWGPVFAGIWLFFLADPLLDGWARRDEPRGVVGVVATLVFAVVFVGLWVRSGDGRDLLQRSPGPRVGSAWVTTLAGLGALMVVCLGEPALAFTVYLGVAVVVVFAPRRAVPMVIALVVGVIALSAIEHWGSQVGTAFGVMAAALAVSSARTVVRRNLELLEAHRANAVLAVDHERARFARDLHDILGHSLTVITVKAELAGRLFDVDADRARTEITDLERLSRDALGDVRRAVEGYRDLSLPGELARARTALAAAEIEAVLPGSTEEVPGELRELFAWTIREGVTNVVRHSAARRCEVLLAADRAEIRDDGVGAGAHPAGAGLVGLRERAAALGASVVTRTLEPGFSVAVVAAR